MHWTVAAPFIDRLDAAGSAWLTPFVPGKRHQFTVIPRPEPLVNWHDRPTSLTGYRDWLVYWQHGKEAVAASRGGVILVFPQLAATVGIQQRLARRRIPVVAWLFNVGTCSSGMRRKLAQASMEGIDRFIVHTKREREIYSQWLDLPIDRFEFIPYQVPTIPILYQENTAHPFLVALGSAHRDFPTLFKAVEKLNLPTVVASGRRALEGLTIPPQVKTPFGIRKQDCLRLAQEARINIVPLLFKEEITAAGQVTIVEAMRMKRAIIATRCNGVGDYIQHGKTGLLVEPDSVDDLTQAIELLWNDAELRNRLGEAAGHHAAENFSDEAAGAALGKVLDDVADQIGMI